MNKINKFCQSCSMPLKQDPKKGGTEEDGSRSEIYCSYCYQNGDFTNPQIDTPKKMQAFCVKKMNEQGMPKFVAWLITRYIPNLERWKK